MNDYVACEDVIPEGKTETDRDTCCFLDCEQSLFRLAPSVTRVVLFVSRTSRTTD